MAGAHMLLENDKFCENVRVADFQKVPNPHWEYTKQNLGKVLRERDHTFFTS